MGNEANVRDFPRPSVLSLKIASKSLLLASYMPFLSRGGIFVPTTKRYGLGDEVFMLLSLMEEPARLPIAGKVIWVTPAGAQGNKTQGIGVQFSDDESGQAAKTQIETLLGGHIGSTRSTHTL
ncbi:MAG TPA: pilus assembly protein PilZ [Rhodocyclaceae bacterium]|nr:MAG: pilus assembly protein PilZ [Betaproteobacteria bacterium CG2_30_68_42]PIX75685.1 MAG: pilus assembly protein PilZ [Rhodocyclales bacterium CG_4_10_14_3_um_filter_68_10]PJA58603.1 MAG: pilus assembly protein PilZ [Rhodocyclales bacterium CG_4_9_14_3_um_filter_68_10]HCX32253.1 pilus assembly protein PilZ [Rhodocyclaceae bacterium]